MYNYLCHVVYVVVKNLITAVVVTNITYKLISIC